MMVEFALPTFSDEEINRDLKLKTEHNQINAAIAGAVSATAAAPLAALINLRLSMLVSLIFMVGCASL